MKQERELLMPLFIGFGIFIMVLSLVGYTLTKPANSSYQEGKWITNTPEVQTTLDRRFFVGNTPTPYATATNFCQLPICKANNR